MRGLLISLDNYARIISVVRIRFHKNVQNPRHVHMQKHDIESARGLMVPYFWTWLLRMFSAFEA